MRELPSSGETGAAEAVRFQRDCYLVWQILRDEGGLPLTPSLVLSRRALRRVKEALRHSQPCGFAGSRAPSSRRVDDFDRERFIEHLIVQLGLAQIVASERKLRATPGSVMAAYLERSFAERVRLGVRSWLLGRWWPVAPTDEEPLNGADQRHEMRTAHRLPGLAHLLAHAEPGDLIPNAPPDARMAKLARGSRADARTWQLALAGPLVWLGIAVETEVPGGPAFHATEAVCALRRTLDGGAQAALQHAEAPGRLVVQGNLELIAYPPLTASHLYLLDSVAERLVLDVAARYRFTQAAVAQAARVGKNADAIIGAVEANSGQTLPANVSATLREWERQCDRVRIEPEACLIEVRDAALLDTLMSDHQARQWIVRRLTPTAALLNPTTVMAARSWLLRHGALPALHVAQEQGPSSPPAPISPGSTQSR